MQIITKTAMKRRVGHENFYRESMVLRMEKVRSDRRWSWSFVPTPIRLGCDGFTRYSDALSIDMTDNDP